MTKEQKLTIAGLKNYLNEWFLGTMSLAMLIDGNSDSFHYIIIETTNNEVIYQTTYKQNEYKGDDQTICSTAGIVDDELRGLVEQCIALDKQMAEHNKQKDNKEIQNIFSLFNNNSKTIKSQELEHHNDFPNTNNVKISSLQRRK